MRDGLPCAAAIDLQRQPAVYILAPAPRLQIPALPPIGNIANPSFIRRLAADSLCWHYGPFIDLISHQPGRRGRQFNRGSLASAARHKCEHAGER